VPAYLEKVPNMPDSYVLFEKTSGTKSNQLLASTFAFQSYAESMYDAATLNEEVKQVVEAMIELDEISGVSLNSDYNYTDTETKKYRYQAVFDINHY
jgi:predicted transcriptional regulator